jgi:hypothetical protein
LYLKGTFLFRQGHFPVPSSLVVCYEFEMTGKRDSKKMAKKATPHLRLRVEPALLVRLEKYAEKNGRTLTGEIVARLEQSFKREDLTEILESLSDKMTVKIGNMIVKQGKPHEGDDQ